MMHARMGHYLRMYEPEEGNVHRLLNRLFTRPAPAYRPSAVILQEKHFPDVSMYQREVDWQVMRSHTDAVIIRAGQNLWEDPQFRRNWQEARRVGMKRGLYWFYDDRIDPGRQADLLVSLIQYDRPEMEIYADWEHSYGGAFGGLRNVVAFMQRVEELALCPTGMYTGYYFFRDHSNALTNAAQYAWLRSRPLWLAWYTRDASDVLIPAPWSSLLLWQWGTPAVGPLWGVQSIELDMNVFNGSAEEFALRYGGGGPPEEEPMEHYFKLTPSVAGEWRSIRGQTAYPTIPHIYGPTSTTSRIQAGQHAKAAPDGLYVYQADVLVDGQARARAGDRWWKIFEANGVGFSGWVAEIHLGVRYLLVTEIGAPEPQLPALTVSLRAEGYPPVDVEWRPL